MPGTVLRFADSCTSVSDSYKARQSTCRAPATPTPPLHSPSQGTAVSGCPCRRSVSAAARQQSASRRGSFMPCNRARACLNRPSPSIRRTTSSRSPACSSARAASVAQCRRSFSGVGAAWPCKGG